MASCMPAVAGEGRVLTRFGFFFRFFRTAEFGLVNPTFVRGEVRESDDTAGVVDDSRRT